MLNRIKPRLSYANAISSIALFVALGGGAYAAGHRIGTNDIENLAVTTPKIAVEAVTGPRIRRGAVSTSKLTDQAVKAGKIKPGAVHTRRLAPGAVRTRRLADEAVTMSKLASGVADLLTQLQELLDVTPIASDTVAGEVTSTAPIGGFEALGGPSVEVTVPSSGLIEVWAQVEIEDDNGGAVALYEDGQPVPGVAEEEICEDEAVLIDFPGTGSPGEFLTLSTPPEVSLAGCGGFGAASPVILQRPPGEHNYELRYSECSCGGEARFRNRLLRVGPRL